MGRKPKVQPLGTGAVSVRFEVPRAVWLIATKMGAALDEGPELGLRLIMRTLASRFEQGDGTFLGVEYQRAVDQARDENYGIIDEHTPRVDISKLHRNTKVKSGYVGVYANGNGFRAVGRHPGGGGSNNLGTYKSAEEAALRRYLYYKAHKLPYGPLEELREQWEKQGDPAAATLEGFMFAARQFAQDTMQEHLYFPEEQSQPTAKPIASEAEVYDTLAKAGIERVSR